MKRSIIKLLEATRYQPPPEKIDQVRASQIRVSKAVQVFEDNFDPSGIPTTFKGTVLSIWYNLDLPSSSYFWLLYRITKVIYKVQRGQAIVTSKVKSVFKKDNRK